MTAKKKRILAIAKHIKAIDGALANLRRKNGTRFVVGEGNLNARIVFVGEAPGKNEAETGQPFAGAAGRVLNELLANTQLNRKDVYITNIVNDRPPSNRDPEPEEVVHYSPFLMEQLAVIQPKVIAPLGRISMRFLLDQFGVAATGSIGKLHGKQFPIQAPWGEAIIAPLYHPAAAIYNPGLKPVMVEDIAGLIG